MLPGSGTDRFRRWLLFTTLSHSWWWRGHRFHRDVGEAAIGTGLWKLETSVDSSKLCSSFYIYINIFFCLRAGANVDRVSDSLRQRSSTWSWAAGGRLSVHIDGVKNPLSELLELGGGAVGFLQEALVVLSQAMDLSLQRRLGIFLLLVWKKLLNSDEWNISARYSRPLHTGDLNGINNWQLKQFLLR